MLADHQALLQGYLDTHITRNHSNQTIERERRFLTGWFENFPIPDNTHPDGERQKNERFFSEESDVFILSGSEDLVPLLVEEDGEWRRKQAHRTLDDGTTYIISYYRPRIEGLFARIEHWANQRTGEVHWRSLSKENITTLYGKHKDSKIADPEDESHIFRWLICESYDDKGNAISYEYKAEDSTNVDLSQPHEKNRTDLSRSANRYLKRVRYGNLTPHEPGEDPSQRTDMCFEVVFDYGEHESTAPTPREDMP